MEKEMRGDPPFPGRAARACHVVSLRFATHQGSMHFAAAYVNMEENGFPLWVFAIHCVVEVFRLPKIHPPLMVLLVQNPPLVMKEPDGQVL
jgi:hypothetical protein